MLLFPSASFTRLTDDDGLTFLLPFIQDSDDAVPKAAEKNGEAMF